MKTLSRSAIKSVDIQAPFERVFGFLANPMNWPQYAVVNLRSASPGENGWFKMITKFGEGEIRVSPIKELGLCDHEWRDPQAHWTVPARIVANGDGVTVMYTLFQPPVMTDQQFDQAMKDMDIEMNTLREIMESSATFEPFEPARSASANVQIVEDLYAAFRRRDLPGIFSLLSLDVEIIQSAELPWGGHYRGHEGAKQFFAKLGAHLNSTLSIERLVNSGDSVTAVGWTQGTVNATGACYRVAIVHHWKIASGSITQAQFLIDNPAMLEALQVEVPSDVQS
jgi:ketosteroid isomerase-like protein